MPKRKPPNPDLDLRTLTALTEAGFVPLHRYIAICAQRGWHPVAR